MSDKIDWVKRIRDNEDQALKEIYTEYKIHLSTSQNLNYFLLIQHLKKLISQLVSIDTV